VVSAEKLGEGWLQAARVTLPFAPLAGFYNKTDQRVVSELNSRESEHCNSHQAPQHACETLEDPSRPDLQGSLVGRC